MQDLVLKIRDLSVFAIGFDPITIARIARVSYLRDELEATKEELIKRVHGLFVNKHMSVFEHNLIYLALQLDEEQIAHTYKTLSVIEMLWPGINLQFIIDETDNTVHLYLQLRQIYRMLEESPNLHANKRLNASTVLSVRNFTCILHSIIDQLMPVKIPQGGLFENVYNEFDYNIDLQFGVTTIPKQHMTVEYNDADNKVNVRLGQIHALLTDKHYDIITVTRNNDAYDNILNAILSTYEPIESLFRIVATYNITQNQIEKNIIQSSYCLYSFKVECPIYVARQWLRHRKAAYNELSRRYTKKQLEFCDLAPNSKNPITNDVYELAHTEYKRVIDDAYSTYNRLINDFNIKPESARSILPLSTMTQFYFTVPKYSLINFLQLRTDKHAQLEIRQFATTINRIVNLI